MAVLEPYSNNDNCDFLFASTFNQQKNAYFWIWLFLTN